MGFMEATTFGCVRLMSLLKTLDIAPSIRIKPDQTMIW